MRDKDSRTTPNFCSRILHICRGGKSGPSPLSHLSQRPLPWLSYPLLSPPASPLPISKPRVLSGDRLGVNEPEIVTGYVPKSALMLVTIVTSVSCLVVQRNFHQEDVTTQLLGSAIFLSPFCGSRSVKLQELETTHIRKTFPSPHV